MQKWAAPYNAVFRSYGGVTIAGVTNNFGGKLTRDVFLSTLNITGVECKPQ